MNFVKTIAVIILIFLGIVWGIGSYLAVDDLKKCDAQPNSASGCEPADAIIAVSGGDTAARATEAIKLYQNGWAKWLVFSGAAADKSGPSNALVMKQLAIDAGVSPSSILIEEQSETTKENAEETKSILDQHEIKSVILVTSAYHERRATLEFNKRALGITVRSHPVATDKHWSKLWWLTATGWSLAIPEFFRSLVISTGGIDRS